MTRHLEFIATGHYAQIINGQLAQASDKSKDQSYFLWAVPPSVIKNCLFPLGGWQKTAVRKWAAEQGLPTSQKKDSTGICFIGPKNFRDFIKQYLFTRPGALISDDGTYLGEHQGALFYTLGQRSGLNIGGQSGHQQLPWYVVGKDLSSNTVVVAQENNHPRLISHSLSAQGIVWHGALPPPDEKSILTRFRHLQPLQEATMTASNDGSRIQVKFSRAQRAINAGQAVVLYEGELCLAGGWID